MRLLFARAGDAYSYNTGETYGVEANDSGYYYMGGLIGEQEYEVMARADGFMSVMETHYLGSSDSLHLDFYLDQAPESGIYGFVENTNGERLSGVNIYPELNGNEFFWAATDDSGYYHVVLPPGPYFISTGINDYYVFRIIMKIFVFATKVHVTNDTNINNHPIPPIHSIP